VFLHILRSLTAVAVFMAAFAARDASADLVFLANGRHLSVKGYRLEGDSIVLVLRQGGEIVCERSMVTSIAPDEVPYPEPVVEEAESSEPLAAVPFGDLIDAAAMRHGVDVRLVRAVVQVESAYRPNARSRKGAKGLMQLMPQTARQYAVTNPYDPASNLDAGVKHLKSLLERFELRLALAAYNAGEAAVRRFGGIPPFQETRDYVRQVLGILQAPRPAL
jgi:soluble lytic murein transglycosylase-like protein